MVGIASTVHQGADTLEGMEKKMGELERSNFDLVWYFQIN